MIRVQQEPEPASFNDSVRISGQLFLSTTPNPTRKDWDKHNYWSRCKNDLHKAYKGICAYSAMYIPNSPYSNTSVDHFLPKSKRKDKAYEWDNYRLSCILANYNKGDWIVQDPFLIQNDSFILVFPSLQVIPNPNLQKNDYDKIKYTIDTLKLNEVYFKDLRFEYCKSYIKDNKDINNLNSVAPFLANEIQRQNAGEIVTQMVQGNIA